MRRGILGVLVFALATVGMSLAAPAGAATKAATYLQYAMLGIDGAPPVAGQTWSYDAQLFTESDSAPVVGVPVTLEARELGETAFTPVATALTDATGAVKASIKLQRTTVIRWSFAGTDDYEPDVTGPFVQGVASRVRIRGNDLTLRRGQRLVITGTTVPAQPGKQVSLWRGRYVLGMLPPLPHERIGLGVVRDDGTIRLARRFRTTGTKRLYVKVAAGGGNLAGHSNYLIIHVR